MPTYEITAPDGEVYEVDAPEGATEAQVMAYAQANYKPKAAALPGTPEDDARRVTQGGRPLAEQQAIVDQQGSKYESDVAALNQQEVVGRTLGIGGRAMLEGVASIPDIVATPVAAGLNTVLPEGMQQADFRGGVGQVLDAAGVPRAETPQERISAGVTGAVTGAAVPIGIGNQLLQAAGPVARGVGGVLSAQPGVQVASSALSSLGSEVARESGASPLVQFGAALVGGALPGSPVGRGASAAKNPELAQITADAAQRGIPLRPGGVDPDGLLGFLRNLPLTGSRGRYADDVGKFNDELAKAIGAPAGTPAHKAYSAAHGRATREFDAIAKQYPFDASNQVLTRLVGYRNTPDKLGGIEPAAAKAIDEFLDEAAQLGTRQIPGQLFKRLDTELGRIPYNKTSTPGLRALVGDLRSSYKAGMAPEDASLWDDLMRRYGDMKTVEPLYAKASGKPIDPKTVLGAITSTKTGKTSTARGTRGEMAKLADIGQRIQEPKSSVAPGLASLAAAAGAGLAATPVGGLLTLLGSNIAGRTADSSWLTRFLTKPAKPSTRAPAAKAAAIGTASSEQSRQKKKKP